MVGTGEYSLQAVGTACLNANDLAAALAAFGMDNLAVGESGTTPVPENPNQSGFLSAVSAFSTPNRPDWTYYGNGWSDWYENPGVTFEGAGCAQNLAGGIPSSAPAGSVPQAAILKYNANGSDFPFTVMPGACQQISVGSAEYIWCLNGVAVYTGSQFDGYQIFQWQPATSTWKLIPGALTRIAVGSDGSVWGINWQQEIFKWDSVNNKWDRMPGAAAQIVISTENVVWVLNSAGVPFYWSTTYNDWQQALLQDGLTSLLSIASNGNGKVWGVATQNPPLPVRTPAQWNGNEFVNQALPGSAVAESIWVGIDDEEEDIIIAIDAAALAYQFLSGGWSQNIPTAPNASSGGQQFVGNDGSVWSITVGTGTGMPSIYQYVNGTWNLICSGIGSFGSLVSSASQSPDNSFWFLINVWENQLHLPGVLGAIWSYLSKPLVWICAGLAMVMLAAAIAIVLTALLILDISQVGIVLVGYLKTILIAGIAAAAGYYKLKCSDVIWGE